MSVLTYAQVVERFGDPSPFITDDGHVAPAWETKILVRIALPSGIPLAGNPSAMVGTMRCHKSISVALSAAFGTIFRAGQWGLLKDTGGCYAWRLQRQAAVLSHHAWGIAVDLNVADNPFRKPPKMPPQIVRAFKQQGFAWGGDFRSRRDGMHFEYVGPGVQP